MSDVQARAAGVRKHVEDEKLWLCCIETFLAGIRRMKHLLLLPDRLPFWFDLIEWIRFAALAAHRISIRNPGSQENKLKLIRGFLVSRFIGIVIKLLFESTHA